MSHQLILDVPNDVYDPLADTAKSAGATPEALALAWLAAMGRHASKDPVEKFIGSMPSAVPEWANRHDDYLGKVLADAGDNARAES